ncbi:MAG: DUF4349 domain-containing protein [Firmicutes bacterium]|nr:DUF4349 domain-containing protein [Bacillota bacterium]
MRLITGCMLATFFCLVFAVPVLGQDERPLRQNYSINIDVECLDIATDIIRGLPGYNLDSSVHFDRWHRIAEFRRRVSTETFRYVQEVLRSLGEVTFETENAAHLATQIVDLDVRIAVLDQELERLTAMMAASTTLEVLIAVNDRLSIVSWDRDNLIGRRNVLQVESQGPIVHIVLVETLPDALPPATIGFGRQITDRFGSSVANTRRAAENFVVGFVRLALPLVIWVVILSAAGFAAWRLHGRKVWAKRNTNKPKEATE